MSSKVSLYEGLTQHKRQRRNTKRYVIEKIKEYDSNKRLSFSTKDKTTEVDKQKER